MKIDITSMFFNSKIEGQTATPAWGTSIGQNKSRECRIDDFKSEIVDMVIGMTYSSISDLENLDVSKGSSDRDIIMCSVFNNVYINNKRLDNAQYTLLLVREHSKSHDGRLLISYAPYISYDGKTNQECIYHMQEALGCTAEGCWFVYDITIKNQSDLFFNAVVVDASAPMVYSNSTKSKNRSEEWKSLIPSDYKSDSDTSMSHQLIFYGAPGTGKSHTIKEKTEVAEIEGRVIRTTFHPDSDYSTFVGCYKPTMKEVPKTTLIGTKAVEVENGIPEEKIVYRFVPQAFTNAYVKAWNTDEPVYLIIEEINRGNCAQIFGDLFQLLDRGDNDCSKYPIIADSDLARYLCNELTYSTHKDVTPEIKEGKKLVLPSNLYIWATMNTSDQSLFPIDSAFKRRWDWKYLPIEDAGKNWKIKVNGNEYDWYKFLEAINKEVLTLTHSEDKQLGYFFAKAKEDVIDAETLVNKVYFYLWTDVFKDYDYESQKAFRKPNSNDPIAFKNFFEDLKNDEKVNEGVAEQVLINLEIEKLNKPVDLFG